MIQRSLARRGSLWIATSLILVSATAYCGESQQTEPAKSKPQTGMGQPDATQQGEDLGQPRQDATQSVEPLEHPLARIGQEMREVEQRLVDSDSSQDTLEKQQAIIDQLELLIRQSRRRSPKSSSGSDSRKPGSGSSTPQGDQATTRAAKPPRDSTPRLGQADPTEVGPGGIQDLMAEMWGHLPVRLREQMQNVADVVFLPQYQELIEDYFERLAEEYPDPP